MGRTGRKGHRVTSANTTLMPMAAVLAVMFASSAQAAAGSIDAGKRLAKANCAACHAIDREGAGPNPLAPPFRDFQRNNPARNLDEVFARGVLVSHSGMPRFAAGPRDLDDLLAYLRSVQSADSRP